MDEYEQEGFIASFLDDIGGSESVNMPRERASGDTDLFGDLVRAHRAVIHETGDDVRCGLASKKRERSSFPLVVVRRIVVSLPVQRFLDERLPPDEFSHMILHLPRCDIECPDEFVEMDPRVRTDTLRYFIACFTHCFDVTLFSIGAVIYVRGCSYGFYLMRFHEYIDVYSNVFRTEHSIST